jgi:serine protease SohB
MELFLSILFFLFKIFIIIGSIYLIMLLFSSKKESGLELTVMTFRERYSSDQMRVLQKTVAKNLWKTFKKIINKEKLDKHDRSLYVIEFIGDTKSSQTDSLKEMVTILATIVKKKDEVLVIMNSPGGQVHQYGYAASQLVRLRDRCQLTVAIDRIGASGGYLMACVAHQILAAPFAIVGSIGVIGQVPNINKLLKKNLIDIEEHTAGAYKRSLSIVGENTPEKIDRFKYELEQTHLLFQNFVKEYRPIVHDDALLSGEHFYAAQSLEHYKLVDKIITSDEYILDATAHKNVVYLKTAPKVSWISRFVAVSQSIVEASVESLSSLKQILLRKE